MGVAISGLLILSALFTGTLMMFRTTLFGDVLIGDAMKGATRLWGERATTRISVTTPPISVDASCTLTVNVENTGATSIVDYPRMDVIAQFNGGSNPPQRLTYKESGKVAQGRWTKTLPAPGSLDLSEPGIFNPRETMEIKAKLDKPDTTSDGTVTIGTPNGVIITASIPTANCK